MTQKRLKIVFFALDGIGHLNASVGLAQALAARGHSIHFLQNIAFKGRFTAYGFEEIFLTSSKTPSSPNENHMKETAENLLASGYLGPKSSLEKMRNQIPPENELLMPQLLDSIVEFDSQIFAAIQRVKADLFVLDHIVIPPSVLRSGIPWIHVWSANPIALYGTDQLPPFGSGYPTRSDPATWTEYQSLWRQFTDHVTKLQAKINEKLDYFPAELPFVNGIIRSTYLNVYGYPEELDYTDDLLPRPSGLVNLEAFCRTAPEHFDPPAELNIQPDDRLVYVSLGSVGSIDVDLMKRIVWVLGQLPKEYKCLVAKGQRGDEYELPANCWGDAYLPQTRILPLVDLVITHGGNNTVTETICAGKPMIVLPLFADQYDNAQRIQERRMGIRLEPYEFTGEELSNAIEQLSNDQELKQKLVGVARRIEKDNLKERACEMIERIVN